MSFSHQVNNITQHLFLYIQIFFCTTTHNYNFQYSLNDDSSFSTT